MKRTTFILFAVGLVATLFMASGAVATTTVWNTYRDDISIGSGTCDIDATFWYNGSTSGYVNLTLPGNVGNLTGSTTNFTISVTGGGTNGTYNLTVNGVACNSTSWCNESVQNITTLTQMVSAGVANTAEYLNFTWNCTTSDTIIGINITGSNVVVSSTWIASVITIKEKDLTTPYVGTGQTTSYFAVNNSMNITSDLWFGLSNVVLNITYPSCKVTNSSANFTISSLAANGTNEQYVQYQKYGPYVYSVDEDVDGTTHTVDVYVKGREATLTNCVDWTLVTSDSVYDDVFDGINYANLVVKLNNVDVDWEQGSVVMDDLTIRQAQTNNKFTFEWTTSTVGGGGAAGTGGLTGGEAGEVTLLGMPWWMAFGIIAIIAVVIVAVVYIEKKQK